MVQPQKRKEYRYFDPSKYSTRLIALKFAYLGQRYNGFEHHANNLTPLPTIEEELWKALKKAHLILPTPSSSLGDDEVNWEGCEYSKCGRTDKGVSAFGQVISVRVRSNRPSGPRLPGPDMYDENKVFTEQGIAMTLPLDIGGGDQVSPQIPPGNTSDSTYDPNPLGNEIPYSQVLNRLLPPDIRILAWCPFLPQDFSARFSCKERRYRYFFTQPAFAPPSRAGFDHTKGCRRREGNMDVQAMRDGAKRFLGLHDFRNFCKVDASKQIANFQRRIYHADIVEINQFSESEGYLRDNGIDEATAELVDRPSGNTTEVPKIYAFVLHGSAFLWHQVRHMVAILFLIGQGLESSDLVSKLLDVQENPSKPMYEMADDAPLVLWDCIFPKEGSDSREDAIQWIYVRDEEEDANLAGSSKASSAGENRRTNMMMENLWTLWRQRKMDEVLASSLLSAAMGLGPSRQTLTDTHEGDSTVETSKSQSQKVFYGGNSARPNGKYKAVLERPRMETPDAINARYALKKGFEQRQSVRDNGYRRIILCKDDDVDE